LALWQELSSWNISAKTDVTNADDAVILHLATPASAIKVFRPSSGTSAVQSGSGSQLSLAVPDEVILVEITP
jgi:hypothetical protein